MNKTQGTNNIVPFDDGSVTMTLFHAGGPQIQWYPNDTNFVDRLSKFATWLDGFMERLQGIKGLKSLELDEAGRPVDASEEYEVGTFEAMGDEFKAKIDEVFDAPVSAAAFAKVNPISPTKNGALVFENFIDAVMPFIERSFEGFSESRERYTGQFKNRAQRRSEARTKK